MARFLILPALVLLCGIAVEAQAAKPAPSAGEATFRAKCAVCHETAASKGSTIGPNLFGVVGRKAGTQHGFAYSKAMKDSGLVWDGPTLAKYLANPHAVVPGNRMPFAGDHNSQEVDALVAYLTTLK